MTKAKDFRKGVQRLERILYLNADDDVQVAYAKEKGNLGLQYGTNLYGLYRNCLELVKSYTKHYRKVER